MNSLLQRLVLFYCVLWRGWSKKVTSEWGTEPWLGKIQRHFTQSPNMSTKIICIYWNLKIGCLLNCHCKQRVKVDDDDIWPLLPNLCFSELLHFDPAYRHTDLNGSFIFPNHLSPISASDLAWVNVSQCLGDHLAGEARSHEETWESWTSHGMYHS